MAGMAHSYYGKIRMKILFVQPTADKKGHYGKYSINLCQELARLGNKVVLFTNKATPEHFLKDAPLFKIIEWRDGKYAFGRFDSARKSNPLVYIYGYLRNSFVIFMAALRYARQYRPDIIQVTDVEFGILSLSLIFFSKNIAPVILLIHAPNFSFSKYPGNILFRCYKVLQREILRRRMGQQIKAIATLGEYHKEELQKQFGLKPRFPVEVIYDGAEPPAVHFSREEARQKLGIEYPGILFLLFGILRKDKGIEYLFEAASRLPNNDFRILIAGSPFDYAAKDISDLVMKFGLEDKIILRLGYVKDEELPFYFYAADGVIFPYRKIYTGGTGPLLKEAAMFKKPVIVSNVSEMGRLVKKREMGLVVEAEDSSSLAQGMREFLSAPAKQRIEWGENAFRAANTWQKMARQYLSLYERIVIPAKN